MQVSATFKYLDIHMCDDQNNPKLEYEIECEIQDNSGMPPWAALVNPEFLSACGVTPFSMHGPSICVPSFLWYHDCARRSLCTFLLHLWMVLMRNTHCCDTRSKEECTGSAHAGLGIGPSDLLAEAEEFAARTQQSESSAPIIKRLELVLQRLQQYGTLLVEWRHRKLHVGLPADAVELIKHIAASF